MSNEMNGQMDGQVNGQIGGPMGSQKVPVVSTTVTVIVPAGVIRRQRRRLQKSLVMSPLLRYALAIAPPRGDGRPNLLPLRIPERCCHKLFSCGEPVRWRVGDGRNYVWFCQRGFEELWEAGYCVQDFTVERWQL